MDPSRTKADKALTKRVTRIAERRANKPNFRIVVPGVEPIVIRRTTDDGHLSDEVEGPEGMKIDRIDVDGSKTTGVE